MPPTSPASDKVAVTTPIPKPDPTPRQWKIPPLHLKALDLSHPGAARFFKASSDNGVYKLLEAACLSVLNELYPPELEGGDPVPLASPSLALEGTGAEGASSDAETESFTLSTSELPHPPPVRSITFHLRSFDGVAYTTGSKLDDEHKEIHISVNYLAGIGGDDVQVKREIQGVLVHELVHVFQYSNGCDGGLIEGQADWVRMRAGFAAAHWREVPGDSKWNAGYSTTAFFLQWLSRHLAIALFVPQLNYALHFHNYNDGKLLKKLLGGKDVDSLWKTYKKELEKAPTGTETTPASPVPTHK
ncbi:plant basic secretory protein [Meredithblackwellia eburnea MCA 4105]